jgi:hypothetical protein
LVPHSTHVHVQISPSMERKFRHRMNTIRREKKKANIAIPRFGAVQV